MVLWAGWTLVVVRCTPAHLVGEDGYYHVRLARMYAARGPLAFAGGRFPWTTASVTHRHFADIEYLFHLLVAPFTAGWRPPPVRTGAVTALAAPTARLGPGSTAVPGTALAVRPAPGLPVVAHLVVTSVSGDLVQGRLYRDDRAAPLSKGFRVDAPGAAGVLVDLGRGRVHLASGVPPGSLTLLEGTTVAGTVRLGPAGAGDRPFTVVHLRGGGLVPSLGAASVEDDRGLVDASGDDAAELVSWARARHLDPSRLPAALRAPAHALGSDTLILRGRLALAFLQVLVLAVLALVLAEHEGAPAALGPLLLLLAADAFAWRFFMVRAQLVSMALLLLGLHLAWRRRTWPLVILGVVYALSYAAPEALVVLVAIALSVDLVYTRVASGRPVPLARLAAPLAGTLLGVAVGVALHPNPGNEVRLLGLVNLNIGSASYLAPLAGALRHLFHLPLLTQIPGMSVAGEFGPPSAAMLVRVAPLWIAAALLLAGTLLARVRPRRFTVQALALSLAWTVLFLRSERFLEYLVPFWALTLALAVGELRQAGAHRRLARLAPSSRRILGAAGALLAVGLAVRAASAVETLRYLARQVTPAPYRDTALWMRSHLPPGTRVFNTDWASTATLLHFDPRQRYLVALDPRYMVEDTDGGLAPGALARIYVGLRSGRRRFADPRPGHGGRMLTVPEVLRRVFRTDYVLVDKQLDDLLWWRLRGDPRHYQRIREDATAVLYRIRR